MIYSLKKVVSRLFTIVNYFIGSWPSALGGSSLRKTVWCRYLQGCGEGVRFGDNFTITGLSSIRIGNKSSFMSGGFLYSHNGGRIEVGDNCSFNHNVMLGAAEGGTIEIGDNVLIGPNVVLRASDHVFDDTSRPISSQGHRGGSIIIDDDVWIVSNVVITKDVHIGKGVVVGAGSVVTHDLSSMTICAGVPAKLIRSR